MKREGTWLPFLAITDVADWKDFSIQFNECVKDFAWESRQGVTPLTAEDIADTVHWVVTRPAHVNVNLIELMTEQQAFGPFQIKRRT